MGKTPAVLGIAALFTAGAVLAAPKIENVSVKPSKADVQVAVTVSRTRFDTGGCDARVDFGDGQGRTIDFGVAGTRNVSHTYKKNGSYKVSVKGTGATPCDGSREAPVTIAGVPEPKKPEAKKPEPAKKTDAKKAPPPKKPAPKKPAPKKDETKKDETPK